MSENKSSENKNAAKGAPPKVIWDDSNMRMSYANVVNATSTREEVTLFFGVNKTWNSSEREFHVALTDRIVVNPYAAKRLITLLNGVLAEYEKRYGTLEIETSGASPSNQ